MTDIEQNSATGPAETIPLAEAILQADMAAADTEVEIPVEQASPDPVARAGETPPPIPLAEDPEEPYHQPDVPSASRSSMLAGLALSVCVLSAGSWGAWWFYNSGPKPKQRKPRANVTLVTVMEVMPSKRNVVISAMGTVVPARQVVLQPRVKGEVVRVSDALIPGGVLAADQLVLEIDPTDYALALKQREGEVARAELAWQLELGQQTIAKSEYDLLTELKPIAQADSDLILRKPHLAAARANLEAVKAMKDQADLDLKRTTISAPFNATVMAKHVDKGTQVSTITQLATLVGTDEYWIQVSLPVSRLKWLNIPKLNGQTGSTVRIYSDTGWGPGVHRDGHVTRLMGDIITEGRMARVLVTVGDPLALDPRNEGKQTMLLGALLRVEIDGTPLDNVFDIPRTALRDGAQVWILTDKDELEVRPVDIAWSDRDRALIRTGLSAGEKLITSDLTVARQGMKLSAGKATTQPTSGPASQPAPAASKTKPAVSK